MPKVPLSELRSSSLSQIASNLGLEGKPRMAIGAATAKQRQPCRKIVEMHRKLDCTGLTISGLLLSILDLLVHVSLHKIFHLSNCASDL